MKKKRKEELLQTIHFLKAKKALEKANVPGPYEAIIAP